MYTTPGLIFHVRTGNQNKKTRVMNARVLFGYANDQCLSSFTFLTCVSPGVLTETK